MQCRFALLCILATLKSQTYKLRYQDAPYLFLAVLTPFLMIPFPLPQQAIKYEEENLHRDESPHSGEISIWGMGMVIIAVNDISPAKLGRHLPPGEQPQTAVLTGGLWVAWGRSGIETAQSVPLQPDVSHVLLLAALQLWQRRNQGWQTLCFPVPETLLGSCLAGLRRWHRGSRR